jgi:preprotein translocase subunit SecG
MLYRILIILLALDSVILVAAVLLQSGQGQGLAATFGGVSSSASSLFGTRQTGNLLTKASWWCGGLFLALAFILSLSSSRGRTPRSVLDQTFPNTPAAPTAPATTPGANPVPLTPAPQTPPAGQGAKTPGEKTPESKAPATKTPSKTP